MLFSKILRVFWTYFFKYAFLAKGDTISNSTLIDGSNYPYWKARIKTSIKALDKKASRSILIGWKHPTIIDKEAKVTLKHEVSWSFEDDRLANYNFKALHVIFNGVDANQIKFITTYDLLRKLETFFKQPIKELVM